MQLKYVNKKPPVETGGVTIACHEKFIKDSSSVRTYKLPTVHIYKTGLVDGVSQGYTIGSWISQYACIVTGITTCRQ
jgi:hypothetical protein